MTIWAGPVGDLGRIKMPRDPDPPESSRLLWSGVTGCSFFSLVFDCLQFDMLLHGFVRIRLAGFVLRCL